MSQQKQRCPAIKPNGRQCKITALVEDGLCRTHSPLPQYVEARTENAIKGGKATKSTRLNMRGFKVRGADDIKRLFARVLGDIGQGKAELDATTKRYISSYAKMYLEANAQASLETELKKLTEALQKVQSGK